MEADQADLASRRSSAILLQLSTEATTCTKPPTDAGKCIYISRQNVFERALQILDLKAHEVRACTVGNDQIIGSDNGIIHVDDINFMGLAKRDAELVDCQRKLLAASSWADVLQDRTETLEAELATVHAENKKVRGEAKMVSVKEELADPTEVDLKTGVIPLPKTDVGKDASTPPPSNSRAASSMLERGKKRAFGVPTAWKTLFKQ